MFKPLWHLLWPNYDFLSHNPDGSSCHSDSNNFDFRSLDLWICNFNFFDFLTSDFDYLSNNSDVAWTFLLQIKAVFILFSLLWPRWASNKLTWDEVKPAIICLTASQNTQGKQMSHDQRLLLSSVCISVQTMLTRVVCEMVGLELDHPYAFEGTTLKVWQNNDMIFWTVI